MSTECTTKLGIRVISEEDARASAEADAQFDLVADGQFRDYDFDLAAALGDRWAGTIYRVVLEFSGGTRAGETVRIDQLAFERPARR